MRAPCGTLRGCLVRTTITRSSRRIVSLTGPYRAGARGSGGGDAQPTCPQCFFGRGVYDARNHSTSPFAYRTTPAPAGPSATAVAVKPSKLEPTQKGTTGADMSIRVGSSRRSPGTCFASRLVDRNGRRASRTAWLKSLDPPRSATTRTVGVSGSARATTTPAAAVSPRSGGRYVRTRRSTPSPAFAYSTALWAPKGGGRTGTGRARAKV